MAISIGKDIAIGRRPGLRLAGGGGCTPFDEVVGSVANGTLFDHPADGVMAVDLTTLAAAGQNIQIFIRQQDSNNGWDISMPSSADTVASLNLFEVVAGVFTQRAAASNVISPGQRLKVRMSGNTITAFLDGVQKWSYASASNFNTRTVGRIANIGTNGVLTDLRTWTLACEAADDD